MNISSRTYSESLVLDDTVIRKVSNSDASQFADNCGCFPSRGKVLFLIHNSRYWPFYFSLGCHLDDSGGHFFRSWCNHWSPCIQSKPSPDSFLFLFVEQKTFTSFIRKVLKNKQAMHHISFLFQEARVVHFLWNQAFLFYYLHSRCCSPPWEHCKIYVYILVASRTFTCTVDRLGLWLMKLQFSASPSWQLPWPRLPTFFDFSFILCVHNCHWQRPAKVKQMQANGTFTIQSCAFI